MSRLFDSNWLAHFQTKGKKYADAESPDAALIESDLQEQIERACMRRMWPVVRSRMDKPTSFTRKGVPDLIIAADNGKTLWIECKSKTGKSTTEQLGWMMFLERNGHEYHLVTSFEQFLTIIGKEKDGI